jgi:hypothetical protein
MNTLTFALNLGSSKSGISDLRAQLRDSLGILSGSGVSTGFTAIGSGSYQWTGTVDDGFRGTVSFYSNAAPSVNLVTVALNPQETEVPSGGGAWLVTIHVTDGSQPVVGATVRLTDQNGASATATSDSEGDARLSVDTGSYTLTATADGYSYTPTPQTVTTTATIACVLTASGTVPPSASAETVSAYTYTRDGKGALVAGVVLTAKLLSGPAGTAAYDDEGVTGTSDVNGLVSVELLKGATYEVTVGNGKSKTVEIPSGASDPYALPTFGS